MLLQIVVKHKYANLYPVPNGLLHRQTVGKGGVLDWRNVILEQDRQISEIHHTLCSLLFEKDYHDTQQEVLSLQHKIQH